MLSARRERLALASRAFVRQARCEFARARGLRARGTADAGKDPVRQFLKRSFALRHLIEAPRARAGENEIDENEAEERREFAVVQDRMESFRGTHQEIGDRREARE